MESNQKKYKVLFLGETYRADAITWMNGVKDYGPFDIITWELKISGTGNKKILRTYELFSRLGELRALIIKEKPVLILAERITSYGFIASLFHKHAKIIAAQQGITDIYPPDSFMVPVKVLMQKYVFRHASLIHAWGNVMTYSMVRGGCKPEKIMVLAKGVDLSKFIYKEIGQIKRVNAIVTRSLTKDYRHETILKAFKIVADKGIPFQLTIVGDGYLRCELEISAREKEIHNQVIFTGRIDNFLLPNYLSENDLYVSMPCTEGVSASLFEAMASGCYPIVSKLPGTEAWITDGLNGRLIEVDNSEKLAESIIWYFNNMDIVKIAITNNRKTIEKVANYEMNMKEIANKYLEICVESQA